MEIYWVLILLILGVSGDVFMGIHDEQRRLSMMKPLVDECAIDSKIRIDYSPDKGIYVVANRDLSGDEEVARVPEKYIMSVTANFPFKETYIDALTQIPTGRSTLRNPLDPVVGNIVQVCQILVNLNTDRQEIEQAIDGYKDFDLYVENWLFWRNYLYSMPDKEVIDTPIIWSKEDNEYWDKTMEMFFIIDTHSDIYDELLEYLEKIKTPKATFLRERVLISKDQFLWASMLVNAKAFTSRYKRFLIVSQNKPKKNAKNHQLNLKYFKDAGVYMMPVADFVNQIHPTKEDLSDEISFFIDHKRGHMDLSASGSFKAGEEYGFLYTLNLPSFSLVATHGYAVEDNILEEVMVSFINHLLHLRPELKVIWKIQECLPQGIRFLTRNANGEQDVNNEYIHFNFRRRDKYDTHFLDYWRIIIYGRIFSNKFDEIFSTEKTNQNEDNLETMLHKTVPFYVTNIYYNGYLTFYSELGAMDQMIEMIKRYLELNPDELPDPDSLPRRKAVCVTAAISQRNMFYHQIRNLKKRTLAMIQTQILNEF